MKYELLAIEAMLLKAGIEGKFVTEADEISYVPAVKVKKSNASLAKFVAVDGAEFAAKTPLQMKQCVNCIKGLGEVTKVHWANTLAAYPEFKTNQPIERIIAFYQKRMLDEGLIIKGA